MNGMKSSRKWQNYEKNDYADEKKDFIGKVIQPSKDSDWDKRIRGKQPKRKEETKVIRKSELAITGRCTDLSDYK